MKREYPIVPIEERLAEVRRRTYRAIENYDSFMARAENARTDREREKRLASQLCSSCFYLQGAMFAGAAITESNCCFCDKPTMFGSTHTQPLCLDCAKQHRLCIECMADIDLKMRRKL